MGRTTRNEGWLAARNRGEHGVHTIPNQCSYCGKFKPWEQLITHFVPDSDYSSESDSYRVCRGCLKKRANP